MALALNARPPVNMHVLAALLYLAEFKAGGSDVRLPDGRVLRVERGQVLVSYAGIGAALGISEDAARRALRTLARVGICDLSRARSATPAATSPTLVDFRKWGGILWPDGEAATSPATSGATSAATQAATSAAPSAAPIQEGTPEPAPETPAGRPARARAASGGGRPARAMGADLEQLRTALEVHERSRGRLGPEERLGGCGRTGTAPLAEQVARLGLRVATEAALQIADEMAARRSGPIRSLAALPGWLETVACNERSRAPGEPRQGGERREAQAASMAGGDPQRGGIADAV
ncbi:hypothetical protein [Anaeromyxobacter dehalogenans]|nr:hypothetical protein [Anaeromyxobacter dehalogenans]